MASRFMRSVAVLGLFGGSAIAQAATPLSVDHAWLRLLPGDLPASGYMVIHNDGDQAVVLVSASSPRYGQVMLHHSQSSADGMSSMVMIDRLPIAAHSSVSFAPGSYHLMLSQASKPAPTVGQTVPIEFTLADGRQLTVPFKTQAADTVSENSGN